MTYSKINTYLLIIFISLLSVITYLSYTKYQKVNYTNKSIFDENLFNTIDRIELSSPNSSQSLDKVNDIWYVTANSGTLSPEKVKADKAKINQIINSLKAVTNADLISNNEETAKNMLKGDAMSIKLSEGNQVKLDFNVSQDSGSSLIFLDGMKVYSVKSNPNSFFASNLKDLSFNKFNISDVVEIRISNLGRQITFALDKQNGEWTSKDRLAVSIKPDQVKKLLSSINDIRILDVAKPFNDQTITNIDDKAYSITLKKENGEEQKIAIGKKADNIDGYYVMIQGQEQVFIAGPAIVTNQIKF